MPNKYYYNFLQEEEFRRKHEALKTQQRQEAQIARQQIEERQYVANPVCDSVLFVKVKLSFHLMQTCAPSVFLRNFYGLQGYL